MWWWSAIKIGWSMLTGGGVSDVVKEVGSYLAKASDNKTALERDKVGAEVTLDVAALTAHTKEQEDANDLRKYRWGWWGERYLMLFAALGPVIHSNAVYLDCIPFWHHEVGSWAIAKAPGQYAGQELKVIAAVVGYSVARAGVAGLIQRFAGRK